MPIALPLYRSGVHALWQRKQKRILAWILAQERPVTVQDAMDGLGFERTTLRYELNRLVNQGEIASAKVRGPAGRRGPCWRYYGRPEILDGLPGWKRRERPCDESYEKGTLRGPEGIMWRVLEVAMLDAARAQDPEAQEEIWNWFADPDPSWFYSCASICAVLDLDQWAILEGMREDQEGVQLQRIREMRRGERR